VDDSLPTVDEAKAGIEIARVQEVKKDGHALYKVATAADAKAIWEGDTDSTVAC
jgi:hypothetical protein